MRFRVSQEALEKELQFLQGVAEKKKTIPILSNILLRAENDFLQLAATDLEVSLTGGCASVVEAAGGITVSAKKLFEVVRSLPAGEIEAALAEGNWLEISCGNAFFRLVGLPLEDFPEVPTNDFSASVKIDHGIFKEIISRTIFAVTQEDARYALNGALLEMGDGTARMVATDAHRLALVEVALEEETPEVKAIVPKKTLTELRQLLSQDVTIKEAKRILEKNIIERTLRKTSGNITHAARLLGIHRPQLSNLLKKYSLKREVFDGTVDGPMGPLPN